MVRNEYFNIKALLFKRTPIFFLKTNKGPLRQLNYHVMFAIHMLELSIPKAYTIGCYYYLEFFVTEGTKTRDISNLYK